ncbi:hypothetical protein SESBI_07880 [Sesbania bispinosa]|nr:hypothetical protein SESBI_07880 [Sesbania bispinosa]
MDMSSSQYNSVDESGWTNYLDQSSLSEKHFQRRGGIVDYKEEEEDLSMVSDASSGPPHYYEEDDHDQQHYCVNWYPSTSQYTKESGKMKKVKEYGRNQQHSSLDDTASSPAPNKKVSFSGNRAVENTLEFSLCFSETRKKGKSKFQKHFSFFELSLGGKHASKEPGGLDEDQRK